MSEALRNVEFETGADGMLGALAGVFTSDDLTPSQWADARRMTQLSPERQMLFDMLLDAIRCWRGTAALGQFYNNGNPRYAASRRERLHREAECWIFGDYADGVHFTFEQACDYLGLDPEYLREGLREWQRKRGGGEAEPIRPQAIRENRREW